MRHDMTQGAATCATGACVVIQTLYRDRGAYDTARGTSHGTTCDTAGHDHDTAPVRATTRRCVHGLGAVYARLVRSVREACAQPGTLGCAPNPVLTQDTILSHCLDHYS